MISTSLLADKTLGITWVLPAYYHVKNLGIMISTSFLSDKKLGITSALEKKHD
jgi:hypothetical protein